MAKTAVISTHKEKGERERFKFIQQLVPGTRSVFSSMLVQVLFGDIHPLTLAVGHPTQEDKQQSSPSFLLRSWGVGIVSTGARL